MAARVYSEEIRAAVLGIILSNPRASVRELEGLLNAQGFDVSRHMINDYISMSKELVHGLAAQTMVTNDVISKPVVQSGLIDAANRINELNDIYYKLKAELESGGLWSERTRFGDGSQAVDLEFNEGLIREMRGCLNDIAKEVGGRSAHAIIEHRNADTGTVDIHAMILNVQKTAEARLTAPGAEEFPALLTEQQAAKEPEIIDIPAEENFLDKLQTKDNQEEQYQE